MNLKGAYVDTTTGGFAQYLPEGPERDQALGLIRIGLKFQAQQCGRRPDALTNYLASLVRELPKPVGFNALLEKLEAESARHDFVAGECVCVGINRVFSTSTFFHPKRGEVEIHFGTLRNKFTQAKFMVKPKP